MNAQTVQVDGRVVSAFSKEPLAGVSVSAKEDSKLGTFTDEDGYFSIFLPPGIKSLVFSYLGMVTQEVAVKDYMEVVLSDSNRSLDEVVITGMQQIDKRLFTGATTSLEASGTLLDGITDISRSLEGRSGGVSVQNVSGTFGTAPKIKIRGATSIYGNSRPLWVVDGVILSDLVDISADQLSSGDAITLISSAVAGLNADDIESFQILKDGSATSIYGAKAMAGVIVITTKKGKAGKSAVNYTGQFTYRLKPSYNQFNISNSQQQMSIYKEMEAKGWLGIADVIMNSSSGVYGKMYQLINQYNESSGQYGLPFTQSAMNAYLREAEYRNTDWFDLLFNENIVQDHSVSVSGGTEKARFYSSFSALEDPGWTLASNVQRYTFNANAIIDLSRTVTFKLLTSDSYRKQKAPGTVSREIDVVRGEVKRDFDINPFNYALNTSRSLDPNESYTRNYTGFNIFDELKNNYIDLRVTDLKFQGELTWKPVTGLQFNLLGAFRQVGSEQEHIIKDHSNQANAYRAGIEPENALIRELNPYLFWDPDDENALPISLLPEGGFYINDKYSTTQLDLRLSGQYTHVLRNKHILNLFGGTELNKLDRDQSGFEGWGYCYDDGGIPSVNSNIFNENRSYYHRNQSYERDLAFFAQTSYSYDGRYVLSLTGRYEGSNKLGKSRKVRWLPTWNVGLAWNIHEESWFDRSKVSHLGLRASYSLVAESGPYWVTNSTPIYKANYPWRPFSSVREIGIALEDIENSELTYEKKKEINLGIDIGFNNNRYNMEMELFMRDNYDLIGSISTPGLGGFIRKYANVADMKSAGIELTFSSSNIVRRNFHWKTDLTFSYVHNEITRLASRSSVYELIMGAGYALEGYPVRSLFSIPFQGLNEDGLPQFINQNGELTVTDINFQESSKINFLKYEGSTDPSVVGGLNNLFSYKRCRLNVFITYSFGNKVRLDPVFNVSYSDLSALPKEFKNRWVLPGDEAFTNIPVIASKRQLYDNPNLSYAYNAYNYSTERIADGGFIRMKEISLAYDFPEHIVQKLWISGASVKLQATNLFLIYADKKLNGQDPEFYNSGGIANPMPRQITFTVKLTI
ncbi:MAG: SusC/RagA family TonB-linked outer membrane protein [Bacteroidales bacterium]|nr:SusC/RagA family TonB-linked outer membrane protein [Bacteroidales bacterium]